ncbi:2667_t:CDS:1, partial [Gigaspora rosea]
DSFISIPDIFNNTDFSSLSDNEDNDININLCPSFSNHKDYDTIVNTNDKNNDININLCPSSSNHKDYDTIVNTNFSPLEYVHNFSLLSEYDDDSIRVFHYLLKMKHEIFLIVIQSFLSDMLKFSRFLIPKF